MITITIAWNSGKILTIGGLSYKIFDLLQVLARYRELHLKVDTD